jgi:hypothetical protein
MSEKFEIYQMAVEMADRVSARRMAANGYFLSVQTALVAILAFAYQSVTPDRRAVLFIAAVLGCVLATTWFFAIRSYRRLNRAKFNVINRLEKDLATQYFTDEWAELANSTKNDVELKSFRARWLQFKDRYTTLTNVETVVPVVFAIIYVLVILGAVFKVGVA